MGEFIGVRSIQSSRYEAFTDASLKREALIFDRIGVHKSRHDEHYFNPEERKNAARIARMIDKLTEHGFFLQYGGGGKEEEETLLKIEEYKRSREYALAHLNVINEIPFADRVKDRGKLKQVIDRLALADEYFLRLTCIELRLLKGVNAHPISHSFRSLDEGKASKSDVVRIVLKAVPIPDESVTWDQVFDYRRDPDSRSKFLVLRNWMAEVSRAELTPAEVEEKLEYLIDQYQKHMKLHRMKTNVGTLETIVTTGAEMLGDVFSFKWGKAAQALFSLKRRRVTLLEGELTAPGNEVAYVVNTREWLS